MITDNCEDCIFYHQHSTFHTHGTCRRYPGFVDGKFWELRGNKNYPGRAIFPLKKGVGEGCGEFKPIDGAGPPDPEPPDVPNNLMGTTME